MAYTLTKHYLTVSPYTRPGIKLKGKKGLVIHYVLAPEGKAITVRNNFEKLKDGVMISKNTYKYASAQFIICLDGSIVQTMDDDEMAYHVGASTYRPGITQKLGTYPNAYTLGIECCHIGEDGSMTPETYRTLVEFSADTCIKNGWDADDVYLHYDVTGKLCHLWFVNNPNEWTALKKLLSKEIIKKRSRAILAKVSTKSTDWIATLDGKKDGVWLYASDLIVKVYDNRGRGLVGWKAIVKALTSKPDLWVEAIGSTKEPEILSYFGKLLENIYAYK